MKDTPDHSAIIAVVRSEMQRMRDDLAATSERIDELVDDFQTFRLDSANQQGFLKGMRIGGQTVLLALAALAGGSATKFLDWLGGAGK